MAILEPMPQATSSARDDERDEKPDGDRIHEAEQRLQAVLANAPLLLFAFDRTGTYTLSAGRELAILGREAADLVGQNIFERYREDFATLECARRALDGDNVVVDARRGPYTFEIHYCPVKDAKGVVTEVIGVATNVTSRLQAEEERARLQAKMLQSQKLESLGILAGGIAHDFNNLLTVIQGNASLALLRTPREHPAYVPLDDILKAAQRAAELTRQMLAYSGKGRFQIRAIDLAAHVQGIASLLRSSIPKLVELSLELRTGLPTVQADATQIQQVIMNLVINAAEAIGDRPGTVTVSTALEEIGEDSGGETLAVDRLEPGPYVRLTVSDTGSGMDAVTRARIFDPFFTTKTTGRGLGLAAVLGIVRGHRGGLRIWSAPGVGSTFQVLLPAAGAQADAAASTDEMPVQGHGVILVIDDERFVRAATCRIVASLGYEVLEASSGKQGLDLFRSRQGDVDLVLLDLTMPEMSGKDTLGELLRIEPGLKVIMLSGYPEAEVARNFGPLGVTSVLQKPFTAQQLAARIEDAVEAGEDDED